MLLIPGLLTQASQRHGEDPIMGLPNLVHYSDPALSSKVFHSGAFLKEILPLKGANKLEQQDPAFSMEFRPDAFGGLGGYGFPDVDRWMMLRKKFDYIVRMITH